jgi:hypothetical protein
MEDIIELKSRYGDKRTLKKLSKVDGKESKTYKLIHNSPYIREGRDSKGLKFIDLEGGPFIEEGFILRGTSYKVEKIDFIENVGIVITFE